MALAVRPADIHPAKAQMKPFKMIHRVDDAVLKAVLAEIHKGAETVPPGFLTIAQWGKRWNRTKTQTTRYIELALKGGILIEKRFRIVTKNRLMKVSHYGPPPKKPRK